MNRPRPATTGRGTAATSRKPVGAATRRALTDRGSVTVEAAILVPAFLMLVVLAAVVGRTAIAQNAVDLAAHDAARAASISRTLSTARSEGEVQARAQLVAQKLDCAALSVTLTGIDGRNQPITLASAFATPVGQPVSIQARVVCEVSYRDLVGAPANHRVESVFVSVMDRYRARSTT